ncbi:MAG: helix-turn-helix domain-containing protein [Oscillospiraceae bacterium]|jgi:transcriptional regulator with XRE-family HTH domain|nr:helix-turn-helix domain-containing protein [Oscillospiraceae bacterium]
MSDYTSILKDNILALRKKSGLTQNAVADKLGVTFQAVSKWESGQSIPDISILLQLAEMYGITIDDLFGVSQSGVSQAAESNIKRTVIDGLPWENDDKLRIVVFSGHRLLDETRDLSGYTFTIEGEVKNVECRCNLNCGDIEGMVRAGADINCGTISGIVKAGADIHCGDVEGSASAGCDLRCGSVGENANAGCNLDCGDIGGDAHAGCEIYCKTVKGHKTTPFG